MPNRPTPHRVGWHGTAEVIDLRWIQPIDPPMVAASRAKTGRLVIAEEHVPAFGWGDMGIFGLPTAGQAWTTAPRSLGLPHDPPIPYSWPGEDEISPSAGLIAAVVRASVVR